MVPGPFGAGAGVAVQEHLQATLGVDHHGAELQTGEPASAAPDALLLEQSGAPIEHDHPGDDQHHRGQEQQQQEADGDLEQTLQGDARIRPLLQLHRSAMLQGGPRNIEGGSRALRGPVDAQAVPAYSPHTLAGGGDTRQGMDR